MTLLEILVALAGTSALMVMLCLMLDSTSRKFTRTSIALAQHGDAQAVEHWLSKDARNLVMSGSLPGEGNHPGLTLPFEATRREGAGGTGSLPHADPHHDSLCFVVSGSHPGGGLSIAAYYVAWTFDSPLKGNSRMSMKLYRHHRPAVHLDATGHAAIYLRAFNAACEEVLSQVDNKKQVSNRALPFLFEWGNRVAGRQALKPWPQYPVEAGFRGPPGAPVNGRVTRGDWEDSGHPAHQSVFPDEPLVLNVVVFEVVPYRFGLSGPGAGGRLGGSELNAMMGNGNGEEWPCLVAPDVLEVRLVTVDDVTARRLDSYEDWTRYRDRGEEAPGMRSFRFNVHFRRGAGA